MVIYDELAEKFGKTVADAVRAMTLNRDLPSSTDQVRDSLKRIRKQPREVWAVKLADGIAATNMVPRDWSEARRERHLSEITQNRMVLDELRNASPYLARRLAENLALWDEAARNAASAAEQERTR